MNIYIAQPTIGLSDDQILTARRQIVEVEIPYYMDRIPQEWLTYLDPKNYAIIGPDLTPNRSNTLEYLAGELGIMAKATLVYFSEGYNISRECRIKYTCAKEFGMYMIVAYPNKPTEFIAPNAESFFV